MILWAQILKNNLGFNGWIKYKLEIYLIPLKIGGFTLLHGSPPRRDDYVSLTRSNIFFLFSGQPGWLKIKKLLIYWSKWENVTKIVRFWEKLPKSKQPACKSFLHLQSTVIDQFSVANFQLFSFVVSLFGPFLTVYQTDWPVFPFMYEDLTDIVRKLL